MRWKGIFEGLKEYALRLLIRLSMNELEVDSEKNINRTGIFCINYPNLAPGWGNVFVFTSDSYCGRQQLSFEPSYVCLRLFLWKLVILPIRVGRHFENAPKKGVRGV